MSDADHRVDLPGSGGWTLWRWFVLRGAGFAAARVLRIAVPELDRVIVSLSDRLATEQIAHARALAALTESTSEREEMGRDQASKLLMKVAAGGIRHPERTTSATPALDALRVAAQAAIAERAATVAYVDAHSLTASESLRDEIRSELFREALAWQNPNALRTGVDHLLRQSPGAADSQTRQHEQLAASYLQRYCVKNDSIGFFGPWGWGELGDATESSVRPGRGLVRQRSVHIEHWAVEALASRMADDPALRPWLAPRRLPHVRLDGDGARFPGGRHLSLSGTEQWLAARANGVTTAIALAREAQAAAIAGLATEQDCYDVIAALAKKAVVVWTLEIPSEVEHPQQTLSAAVASVGDPGLRARLSAELDHIEQHRVHLASAAGDSKAVLAASAALNDTFHRLTGQSATRHSGQTYAARTVVYEDCCRDVDIRLGSNVLDRIGPALAHVLTSARWFTHAIGARYRKAFRDAYDALRSSSGSGAVELSAFLQATRALFSEDQYRAAPIVASVVEELHRRWREVLQLDETARRVSRSSSDLAAEIARVFDAPGPGWPSARHQSPDVLLAASSAEQLQNGEFVAVLGELHPGANMALVHGAVWQHPRPAELIALRRRDIEIPTVVPTLRTVSRAAHTALGEDDFQLETGTMKSWRTCAQILHAADLIIEDRDGELRVHSTDGRVDLDVIAFMEHFLAAESVPHFSLLPGLRHSPRIDIDGLVVNRERWRFDAGELPLPFAAVGKDRTRAVRLVEANLWAQSHRMPRWVFAKVPEEPKPFYVDFHCPILVEVLAKAVRQASSLVISEMLPSHGQFWLPDAEGNVYTSELRFVAVDPVSWRAPGAM